MPIKRRILKEQKGYGQGHLYHFFWGHDFFRDGFGVGDSAKIASEMAAAWPLCRESVFELARQRAKQRGFTKIPAYWWVADSPEPRDESIAENEQLLQMGIDPTTLLFG